MVEDNIVIKQLLESKKYKECINIIKNKIIEYIVGIIKKQAPYYEYTNIIDLIEISEQYIYDERKNIARNIEYFSFEEDEMVILGRLLEICEIYDIK